MKQFLAKLFGKQVPEPTRLGTPNIAVERIKDDGKTLSAEARICGGPAHDHFIPLIKRQGSARYRLMRDEVELLQIMYDKMTGPPAPIALCECDIDRSAKKSFYSIYSGPAPMCFACGKYLDIDKIVGRGKYAPVLQ